MLKVEMNIDYCSRTGYAPTLHQYVRVAICLCTVPVVTANLQLSDSVFVFNVEILDFRMWRQWLKYRHQYIPLNPGDCVMCHITM